MCYDAPLHSAAEGKHKRTIQKITGTYRKNNSKINQVITQQKNYSTAQRIGLFRLKSEHRIGKFIKTGSTT